MYDAQADTIDVDDIATNSNNRIVLRRLRRNDANDENNDSLWIQNVHDKDGEDCIDYVPEGTYDMGWLGYFVGKNEHLRKLNIRSFRDVIEPFLRGVNRNKSIREIGFYDVDLLGGEMFTMLTPFFQNTYNLTTIIINDCNFGDEGCRLFALALGNSTNRSLKQVDLSNNNITEEGMVDIISSLSMHSNLKHLDVKQLLQRRKESIMRRLGGNVLTNMRK